MKKIYNSKIDREVMLINPGEYYTSAEDVICTILGSCVSVVLYSNKKHIGGINHFMLPAYLKLFSWKTVSLGDTEYMQWNSLSTA